MLVGDSHARLLGPALGILAKEQGFNLSVQILGSCPWLQGLVTTNHARRAQEDCARARNDLYDTLLEESDTDIVVLTQQGRDNPFWNRRLARSPGEASREPLAELLADTTEQTLRRLSDRGIRTLVVHSIWLPPNDYGNPLDCLARAERLQQCRVPISPAPGLLDAYYLAVSSQLEGVHTVDINLALCPAAPVCDPLIDGIPVWRDAGHYTPAAISHQRELIWRAIRETGVFDGLT
jgi:hypothetical protein